MWWGNTVWSGIAALIAAGGARVAKRRQQRLTSLSQMVSTVSFSTNALSYQLSVLTSECDPNYENVSAKCARLERDVDALRIDLQMVMDIVARREAESE
jgi:hypothetical protein